MRAMSRAECIVDVEIAQLRQRFRELRIVRFFPRLEADVLEQSYIAVLHMLNDFFRHLPNGVVTKNNRLMDERMQLFADRTKGIFWHRLSVGPAKMRHQYCFRALFTQVVDRRQAFPNPRVISNADLSTAIFSRHVEVHAHQNALPAYIQIANRELRHVTYFPKSSSNSTQRLL